SSENRYLGIWYKQISDRTVVWVANRDRPLPGTSRLELKIADRGILGLFSNRSMIWSSNTTTSGNATAKLWDNGNLVVIDQQERVFWQSFDYPTDTLLPGMKLGRDNLRNKEWYLTPWKSSQDPAPGELTWGADRLGYPENKLRQGASIIFRGGPWSNERFPGVSVFSKSLTFRQFHPIEGTLNSSVHLESWAWVDSSRGWQPVVSFPRGACDTYNICNAYGTCSIDMIQQSCKCLDDKRFVPRNQKGWDTADWRGGCIRRTPLECKNGSEGFIEYPNVKLPDAENTWFNMNMTLEECGTKCLQICSCMAYANPEKNQSVCLLWFDDLLDIQVLPEGSGGPNIFVRMASSELDSQSISKNEGRNRKIVLLVVILGVFLIGLIITTWLCYARRKRNHAKLTMKGEMLNATKSQEEDMELPLFSFSSIANATANFSPDNKLGEGGFGPVYKGVLEDGKEIAVKRLSKNSSQGINEFKNEVICISKLQHRNLVKLLGCCIQGDEKLLIYEYMPNKSLDSFIFDVFSFGVLVLEIVSGKRNRGFIHPVNENNLVGHVWSLYNEEKELPVVNYSSSTYTGGSLNDFTIT
ncbi:hypothetical protein M8C21_003153, partial [Ambrosia artemisiifolia]